MTAALSIPPHSLSIVVPFYNEEDNIAPLVKRVHEALAGYQHPWELVLVDDGAGRLTQANTSLSPFTWRNYWPLMARAEE